MEKGFSTLQMFKFQLARERCASQISCISSGSEMVGRSAIWPEFLQSRIMKPRDQTEKTAAQIRGAARCSAQDDQRQSAVANNPCNGALENQKLRGLPNWEDMTFTYQASIRRLFESCKWWTLTISKTWEQLSSLSLNFLA